MNREEYAPQPAAQRSDIWFEWTVPPAHPAVGRTLGDVLRRQGISLRLLRRLKRTGGILVNGEPHQTDYLCQAGDHLQLVGGPSLESEAATGAGGRPRVRPELATSVATPAPPVEPEPLPLRILYEDAWLLAVDKPAGQLTHPVRHERHGTVANAVAYHWLHQAAGNAAGAGPVPGYIPIHPVQRLDRQTSGVLLFARNPLVHQRMQQVQAEGKLHKEYLAIVELPLYAATSAAPSAGIIDWPLAPVPGQNQNRRRQVVNGKGGLPPGRPALTRYRCLQRIAAPTRLPRALLQVEPETGRTHQIRLHLAACGWPIVGDPLYGTGQPAPRMALHAWRLVFRHPFTGQWVELEASLPADLQALLAPQGLPIVPPIH